MKAKIKGSNAEREMQRMLSEKGYVVMRIAGSGSSRFPACDLIAAKDNIIFVIEVKSSIRNRVYIKKRQMEELEYLARKFNAVLNIVAKMKGKWYLFIPENMKYITNKYYVLRREEGIEWSKVIL